MTGGMPLKRIHLCLLAAIRWAALLSSNVLSHHRLRSTESRNQGEETLKQEGKRTLSSFKLLFWGILSQPLKSWLTETHPCGKQLIQDKVKTPGNEILEGLSHNSSTSRRSQPWTLWAEARHWCALERTKTLDGGWIKAVISTHTLGAKFLGPITMLCQPYWGMKQKLILCLYLKLWCVINQSFCHRGARQRSDKPVMTDSLLLWWRKVPVYINC